MKIKGENFKEMFSQDEIPNWVCPNCDKGTLSITKDGFRVLETAETLRLRTEQEHEPDWDKGLFVCRMVCNNTKCKEPLLFTGDAGLDFAGYHEETDDDSFPSPIYVWFATPKHFSKPIKLFEFHTYYPKAVTKIIESAFGLMWFDPASCANKIRIAVELILDDLKIPNKTKVVNKSGKTEHKTLTLHNRLDKMVSPKLNVSADKKGIYKDAGHFLLAIKWIGNVGSHAEDGKLKRDVLIEAFEMLESSLDLLYNKHTLHLKKRASKIIKKRGVAKKRK